MISFRKRRTRRARSSDRTPRAVLIRQIAVGIGVITLLILLGAGVWYGTRIDVLTISTVTVSGGETIEHDAIREQVEAHLAGSYFLLVPRRFAWTYPKHAITATLASVDRIKTVSVDRVSGTELSVSFTEYRPDALWCDASDNDTCVFVDELGYAFAVAPSLVGGAFFRYFDPARPPVVGTSAYTSTAGNQFREFAAALDERYGMTVTHVEQIAPNEIAYRLTTDAALKVTMDMPLEEVLANLDTILAAPEFTHLTNGDFAYIDLRYGSKVFVKEEDTVPVTEEAAATTSVEAAAGIR